MPWMGNKIMFWKMTGECGLYFTQNRKLKNYYAELLPSTYSYLV